jgi:DNA primase
MDRDRVLEATDLVALISEHVRLQPKGSEFVGLCPFHDDKKPSMHVVPTKGFYHCFACGEHGNAIDFLINFHKMDFRAALEALANRAGIELTARRPQDREVADRRTQLLRANERAFEFYRRTLRESEAGQAKALLADRGISQESIDRFGIGLAPDSWDSLKKRIEDHGDNNDRVPSMDIFEAAGLLRMSKRNDRIDYFRNRLIFPIRDELGRPIAFGARRIDPRKNPSISTARKPKSSRRVPRSTALTSQVGPSPVPRPPSSAKATPMSSPFMRQDLKTPSRPWARPSPANMPSD